MGREALDWVTQGGKPQRGSLGLRWSYRWQQFWFEQNLRLLNAKCAPEEELRPPVFVMGMWRSGTTFLHDLLSTNTALVAPTTWQCMHSSIHVLERPRQVRAVQRPMDGFDVTPDSPQEDEFAILAQGVPSVYRAFFDPRRLKELETWLDPQAWADLPAAEWWPRWRRFLASVQLGHRGRLLLKSPNHIFRIRAILRELPQSSFVWVLRNPREVFFSNMKMWKAMFERYALWQMDKAAIDEQLNSFLVSAFRFSIDSLREATSHLSQTQLAAVRFEDLVERPEQVLQALHHRLRIPWDTVDPRACREVIARAGAMVKTRYDDRGLPSHVQAILDPLEQSYARIHESHGV